MDEFRNSISYFFRNRRYMASVIIVAVAAFGFEIVHGVVGLDDICISRYFADGLGLQIGRWPFFILSRIGILGLDMYIPFLTDFVAVLFLIFAGMCWCVLFQRIFSRNNINISIWCHIAFTAFFMSYSLIAYVFVYYLHNGIAIAHICIAFAILLWDDIGYCTKFRTIFCKRVIIIGLVTIAVSFYESFAAVFILGLCIYWGINELFIRSKAAEYIKQICLMGMTLVIATVCRTAVCLALAKAYDIPLFMRKAEFAKGLLGKDIKETIDNIVLLLKLNYGVYIQSIDKNSVILLDLAIGIVVLSAIYLTIKRKNTYFVFNAIIGIGSLFIMSFFTGDIVYERSTQNMSLFIGFAFFILGTLLSHKKTSLQLVIAVIVIVLEWNNLCIVNFLFYSESKNNEKDIAILNDIGERIMCMGGDGKPVAFVGELVKREIDFGRISTTEYPTIHQNVIEWAENAFNDGNKELIHFFVLNGYSFSEVSEEQLEEARKIAVTLPAYPLEGCISDQGDYIAVKLGKEENS